MKMATAMELDGRWILEICIHDGHWAALERCIADKVLTIRP